MDHIRTESGLFVPAHMKASTGVTGPGAYTMTWNPPLTSASRNPQALMRQAQALFHTNGWVGTAVRTIVGRFTSLPWHLEDASDETVDSGPVFDLMDDPIATRQGGLRTRRDLWSLTGRHTVLCGTSFWYGDQADLAGIPLKFLYINPARMWPVQDKAGNLLDWVLDADGTDYDGNPLSGVPLGKENVHQFVLDPPDSGHFGIGIVERVWGKADLSRLSDQHARGVLASGGRLSGMVSPKNDAMLDPDAYESLVKDFRSIVSDPDAAKKLLIVKQPVDFTSMSASPQQLDLDAISRTTRDDIFALFQVPPSQAGVPGPGGLNSGETKKYDEAVLHQNAVHPLVVSFKETLQLILDRVGIDLEIDEPSFDDDTPKYEIAQKAQGLPLTNDQRLALVGLPPLGPTNGGNDIYLPVNLALVGSAQGEPVKAKLPERKSLERVLPSVKKAVASVLQAQRSEIARRVRERHSHLVKKPSDVTAWWDEKKWRQELEKALKPHLSGMAGRITLQVRQSIAPGKASFEDAVVGRILREAGKRITGITDTTREDIQKLLLQGLEQGLSPAELGDLIENATTFDEYRAELIARTETAIAYNEATTASYEEYGVTQVEVVDGDQDDVCADANGQVWSMEEAYSNPIGHPQCTRDFLPVFGTGKAKSETRTRIEYDDAGRPVAVVTV